MAAATIDTAATTDAVMHSVEGSGITRDEVEREARSVVARWRGEMLLDVSVSPPGGSGRRSLALRFVPRPAL